MMDYDKIKQDLEDYFANVTEEQFKQDLIDAGFEIVEGIPGQIIIENPSFKVTCLQCGNEIILNSGIQENTDVQVYSDIYEIVQIKCKCGNYLET